MAALESGLKIARDCGFGLYHIDLLLQRARLHLLRGDAGAALDDVDVALDTGILANEATGQPELLAANHEACGYAWAMPAGLQLRAEALLLQAAQQLGRTDIPVRHENEADDGQESPSYKLIDQAKQLLQEVLDLWQPLHDPEPERPDQNFQLDGKEYNYRAAECWQILQDLAGGVLTRYPVHPQHPPEQMDMKDFFVSYNGADKNWAEWIAWTLEEAGYTVEIQAWDFRPGENFVLEMQKAIQTTNRTIAVLSQNYLDASYTYPEWAAALVDDPKGESRKLIPVRVGECEPTGLLKPITYVNLVGLTEDEASLALLGAFSERVKPDVAPVFPGATRKTPAPTARAFPAKAAYPGSDLPTTAPSTEQILDASGPVIEKSRRQHAKTSQKERLALIKKLNELLPEHFNMLVFAIDPPAGLIPGMPAPQASRALALLGWAESPAGCGTVAVTELMGMVVGSADSGADKSGSRIPETQHVLYIYKNGRLVHMQVSRTPPAVPNENSRMSYIDQQTGDHGFGIVQRVEHIADPETNSVTVYLIDQPAARSPGPTASGGAVDIWREKLEYLRQEEAMAADAAQKFALKKHIEEAERKIRELGGNL